MNNKTKYRNIDELVDESPVEGSEQPRARTRLKRPTPAVGVTAGDRPKLQVETLKEEKEAALKAEQKALQDLAEIKENFIKEKEVLLARLDEQVSGGAPVMLTMPITKQEVKFEVAEIDPDLIDVSPENERIQTFLDEISLQDILPSIIKHGQQKPGTVRPRSNGRYELIEGSRRLAAIKNKKKVMPDAGVKYIAFVGDVPDADVRELSNIENKHKDVSAYEKALAFKKMIDAGDYSNWNQLGVAKNISSTHILRFKACAALDEIFVRILPSPSDMPLSYGETIDSLIKKGKKELYEKAEEILQSRSAVLSEQVQEGSEAVLDFEEILKQLRSAVRTKMEKPTLKKPLSYKSKDGKTMVKHTVTNKGNNKLEFVGVSDEKLEKVLAILKSTLKLEG